MKNLLLICLILTIPSSGWSDVSFDAAASGSVTTGTSLSWNITTAGGTVFSSVNAISATTSDVTCDGTSITKLGSISYSSNEESAWQITNLAPGTHTFTATFSGSAGAQGGSISLNGAAPADAIACSSGSSTSPSVSVTTTADNSWVLDGVGDGGAFSQTLTVGGGQTQRWNQPGAIGAGASSTKGPVSPAGSTTMSWTIASSMAWGHCAASYKAATAASAYVGDGVN